MHTKQPKWSCIANLGDVNPLEYGAILVLVDRTNAYDPEMIVWHPSDEDEKKCGMLARFVLEPIHVILNNDGTFTFGDNKSHPNNPAWWADKAKDIASFVGTTLPEFAAAITSDDVTEVARAYDDIASYFGYHEFDDDAAYTITLQDAKQACGKYLRQLKRRKAH